MSVANGPSLVETATSYWKAYAVAVVVGTVLTAFAGGFAALVVVTVAPEAGVYFGFAFAGFVFYASAIHVRETENERLDQTRDDSRSIDRSQLVAFAVIVGTVISGLLLFGTGLAFAVDLLTEWPAVVALGVAAYYPLFDVELNRRGVPTPVGLLTTVIVRLAVALFGVRGSIREQIPIVGDSTRRRSPR